MPRPRRINRNATVFRCIIDCFSPETKSIITDTVDIPEKIFESRDFNSFVLEQQQFKEYRCTKVIDTNIASKLKKNYYITEYNFFLKANSQIIE